MPSRLMPKLSSNVVGVFGGYLLTQFGVSLVTPFLMVYVHNALHFSTSFAGWVIGMGNVSGMVLIPLSGWMVEKVGARTTVICFLTVSALGLFCFAAGYDRSALMLASVATTGGMAAWWNSLSAMFAGLSESRRTDIFGVAYVLQNLGGGAGAFVGGRLIDGSESGSFVTPFIIASLSSVVFAMVVLLFRKDMDAGAEYDKTVEGLQEISNDHWSSGLRAVLGLGVAYGLFAVVITALPGSAFSEWAINQVGTSMSEVGLAFTVSTMVVVFGQFIALRLSQKYRRTELGISSAVCYAVACVLIYLARYTGHGFGSLAELYAAFALFGIGDTLLFPMIPALVNDLASNEHRGRYNSIINFSWQAGSMVGPLLAGVTFQMKWYDMFFSSLVFLCLLIVCLLVVVERVILRVAGSGEQVKLGTLENKKA